ncbi:MAG: hypothetical protein KY391_03950 [Actinobacteria bacterium]|nr:hypothetical protein [Actinomycetota bacterium]
MDDFLSGLVVALCLVVTLVFLRFWRQSHDRLFGFFSGSFALLALNYLVLTFNPRDSEIRPYLYLVRLAAFLLIIFAILDKNRKSAV